MACPAGYQCPSASKTYSYSNSDQGLTACTPGHYQDETGQTSCKEADVGYIAQDYGARMQMACSGAMYQDKTGQSSCIPCPKSTGQTDILYYSYRNGNKTGDHTVRSGCYARFGAKTLDDGEITQGSVCFIDKTSDTYGLGESSVHCEVHRRDLKCNGGYYNRTFNDNSSAQYDTVYKTQAAMYDGVCRPVEAGYWSADESLSRTACASGTTIGYGAGADESGDCGRVMNVGGGKLYLRSERKTAPSFNVTIGSTTYYGNMSTADKNMSDGTTKSLKANVRGTTYSVYDDSAN